MAVHQSFNYSPTELAEQMSSATQDMLIYLWNRKYITTEQYYELSGKLIVMAVPNRKGFGRKLLEKMFGVDNNEENAWVFPIVEVADHYAPADPPKPDKSLVSLKKKPSLKVVE